MAYHLQHTIGMKKLSCRFTVTILFFTVTYFTLAAQSLPNERVIDSLRNDGYKNVFTDSAQCINKQKAAVYLANKENNKKEIVLGYTYLTLSYLNLNHPKDAVIYADSAMQLANTLKTPACLGYANMAMGLFKSYIENNTDEETFNYLFKAYLLLSEIKDYKALTRIATELVYMYQLTNNISLIKKYATEALEYGQQSGDVDDIVLGKHVYGFYLVKETRKNILIVDSAIRYFNRTIDFIEKNEHSITLKNNCALIYLNLAVLYFEYKQSKEEQMFFKYINKTIAICQKYHLKNIYPNAMGLLGDYYRQKGNYITAEQLFLNGIAYVKSLSYEDNYTLFNFYMSLKELATKENDYKKYFIYDTAFMHYRKLNDIENEQKLAEEADAKYELSLEHNKISLLEKAKKLDNTIKKLWVGIAVLLLTGLLFVLRLLYFRKKYYKQQTSLLHQKQKNTELELELQKKESIKSLQEKLSIERKLLQTQMDPHFVFNALANIQGMLLQKKSNQIATNYLSIFSKYVKQVLILSKKDKIYLEEEIELLQNYIAIQQLHFGKTFEFEINYGNLLNDDIMIPPMMIQPFVENAIEHGLKFVDDERKEKLSISFYEETQDYILCLIEDNGIGFKTPKGINEASMITPHMNMSMQIIQERIQKLKEKNPKSEFSIKEVIKDGKVSGTVVSLIIPCL